MNFLKLTTFMLFFGAITVFSMEVSIDRYAFLKKPIHEIQNFAEMLSQETGRKYRIVKKSFMMPRSLEVLGLNTNNTPLDIRYHYDLLMQKLSVDEPAYDVVKRAYKNLMNMIATINGYKMGIEELMEIKLKQVEEIELQEILGHYNFLKNKQQLIKNTVKTLRKQLGIKKVQRASDTVKKILNLPMNASAEKIEEAYKNYMEHNSSSKLIALKNMNQISTQNFKNKMGEIENIKKTYKQYLKEIQQFK